MDPQPRQWPPTSMSVSIWRTKAASSGRFRAAQHETVLYWVQEGSPLPTASGGRGAGAGLRYYSSSSVQYSTGSLRSVPSGPIQRPSPTLSEVGALASTRRLWEHA